jgi:protein-S-isoprenylcysteine O-methyltransferase Ste14
MKMEKRKGTENNFVFRMIIPVLIAWICIMTQIGLTFFLWDNYYGLNFIVYIGYGIWALAAVFGVVPIFQFKKKGGVNEGESYMKTTIIVTTGLYAIVRHPQYLAGILISIALACMSQHWFVDLLILPPIISTYFDARREDKKLLDKFGDAYMTYMKYVSRLDPISGIIRWLIRALKKET